MQSLYVIKIGGNIIDDDDKLEIFLQQFAGINEKKILVHGGGVLASSMAEKMQVPQQLIDGRRITDIETLKIVTMVYAGYINKKIVARLLAVNCNALGLSGADGNAIMGHKRKNASIDYGYVGDIDKVNNKLFTGLLNMGYAVIVAPIIHDGKGQLLNTNADTIAQEIATAMSSDHDTTLIYSFEKSGVLLDIKDENSRVSHLDIVMYADLKDKKKITAGMIPKLDNAFKALKDGVKKVIIGDAGKLNEMIGGHSGTTITSEK